jgi:hypothetical protein
MLLRTRRTSSGFIEPCLPSPADRPPSGPDWIHEIKHDGYRLMARRDPIGIRLLTRNGHDWASRYPLIVEAVDRLKVRSCLIDGEAVACDKNGLAVRREPLETRKATLARSAFIRGEFEQDIPDPSIFGRMARRVEGLSKTDLEVLALVHAFDNELQRQPNRQVSRNPPFVCGSSLANSALNHSKLSTAAIQESLVDLAARGFLRADGASRTDKHEEYYYPTSSLRELIERAGEHIK